MKLLVCIIDSFYAVEMEEQLRKKNYRMTKLASTGGFRKKGNTTFLFGVEEVNLDDLSEELKAVCLDIEGKKQKSSKQAYRYTSFLLDINNAPFFINP